MGFLPSAQLVDWKWAKLLVIEVFVVGVDIFFFSEEGLLVKTDQFGKTLFLSELLSLRIKYR